MRRYFINLYGVKQGTEGRSELEEFLPGVSSPCAATSLPPNTSSGLLPGPPAAASAASSHHQACCSSDQGRMPLVAYS